MTDEAELKGLDASDLLDREAARIDAYYASIAHDDGALARPSRCEGWSVRDVLSHFLGDEEYFQACLDGAVGELFQRAAAEGVTDVDSFNALGVRKHADRPVGEVLDEWRRLNADTRRRFRERGDGEVDTSVGPYPARWQAFHLALEYATHADDVDVPVDPAEADERLAWRARVSRFTLAESKADAEITRLPDGRTRVSKDGATVEVDDADLVEGVAARLPADGPYDDGQRALLSTMP